MPRYKTPDGLGINIGGQQFNADDKGIITIPDTGEYRLPDGYERMPDIATPAVAATAIRSNSSRGSE